MSTFPKIAGGQVVSQRPYTSTQSFLHTTNELPSGGRIAYSWRTNPLSSFVVTYTHIPTSDVKVIEDFFNSMCGRYGSFSFTDITDGTTYTNCRFDDDALLVRYNGVNDCSLSLKITSFAA